MISMSYVNVIYIYIYIAVNHVSDAKCVINCINISVLVTVLFRNEFMQILLGCLAQITARVTVINRLT